jgi:hypothetical protein
LGQVDVRKIDLVHAYVKLLNRQASGQSLEIESNPAEAELRQDHARQQVDLQSI